MLSIKLVSTGSSFSFLEAESVVSIIIVETTASSFCSASTWSYMSLVLSPSLPSEGISSRSSGTSEILWPRTVAASSGADFYSFSSFLVFCCSSLDFSASILSFWVSSLSSSIFLPVTEAKSFWISFLSFLCSSSFKLPLTSSHSRSSSRS